MGFGPIDCREGDYIYAFPETESMFVLRPQRECHLLFGECFLHLPPSNDALARERSHRRKQTRWKKRT